MKLFSVAFLIFDRVWVTELNEWMKEGMFNNCFDFVLTSTYYQTNKIYLCTKIEKFGCIGFER